MSNLNRGHRKRTKAKFALSPSSFQDYEILEMLLYNVYPRCDTKDIAKRILASCGSLKKLYLQDLDSLSADNNLSDSLKFQIRLLQELFTRLTIDSNDNAETHILGDWNSVLRYLKFDIGYKTREYFKVLYLNRKNVLINTQLFDSGTVDKVVVYPREIVKGAINNNASAIVIAHNHPSGDPTPSKQDIRITELIRSALETVEVTLHDHIIIANDKHYSFKNEDLF